MSGSRGAASCLAATAIQPSYQRILAARDLRRFGALDRELVAKHDIIRIDDIYNCHTSSGLAARRCLTRWAAQHYMNVCPLRLPHPH